MPPHPVKPVQTGEGCDNTHTKSRDLSRFSNDGVLLQQYAVGAPEHRADGAARRAVGAGASTGTNAKDAVLDAHVRLLYMLFNNRRNMMLHIQLLIFMANNVLNVPLFSFTLLH